MDCGKTMASLGIEEADPRTQRLIFNLTDGQGLSSMYCSLFAAYGGLQAGRVDIAALAAARSLELNGKFAQGHVAKALVALRRGDICAAKQSFEDARRCNAPANRILLEFEEACCAPNPQGAAAAIEHLESMGFTMAGPWREIIRLGAAGGKCMWPPGLFPMRASDYDRLAPEFASVHIPGFIPAESLERIGEVLEMENRLDEAANVYGRILLKAPADTGAQRRLSACAEPVRVTCAPSDAPALKGEGCGK
jgi:tetratricopeptide (TPR) repeat protein